MHIATVMRTAEPAKTGIGQVEVLKARIVNLEVEADVDAPSCRPTTPLSLELGKVKHKSLLFTLSFFSHLFFFLYLLLSFGIAPLLLSWSFV